MNTETQNQSSRILWVINILIIIAVAVLFYLQFNKQEEQPKTAKPQMQKLSLPAEGSTRIAFVNSDIILQNYELVNQMASELEKERKRKDNILKTRQKEFDQEAAYFQESVQKQSISEASAQNIYEQLMEKQQEIYALQDQYGGELQQKEFKMNMVLLDSVRNYLHRINVDYQFDYILNFNETGGILLAKDTFDITNSVVKGLNMEYKALKNPE